MNILDEIIKAISPSWGYKRETWRQCVEEQRHYDASSMARGDYNWRLTNESAENSDKYSRDIIRARARDLERNSNMFNSVVLPFKRNVIGAGYELQAKTDDEEINNLISELWKKWCQPNNCDVTGQQSFTEMLRMCVTRKKVDGGILIVKRYTNEGMIPLQLQILEVDELDITHFEPYKKGNRVVGGIEYNIYNKPQGYWFKHYDIEGYVDTASEYIDASGVFYYFSKKRPSQIREISDMSATITDVRDTNEFMKAVSIKQRVSACLSIFIKKANPQGEVGRRALTDTGNRYDYDGKTLVPGMIHNLNQGDDVETINPSGQADDATSHVKLQQRMSAAGAGLSYETTSRDMSQCNYSSARQGNIEDECTFTEEIEKVMKLMDMVYETFVDICVLKGLLNLKTYFEDKDNWLNHTWIKAPKKWIDPLKEANANRIALLTGQKTFMQICSENGKSYKEVIDDNAEAITYAKEKGIDIKSILLGGGEKNNGKA